MEQQAPIVEQVGGDTALRDMTDDELTTYFDSLPLCGAQEMVRLCFKWITQEIVDHRRRNPECSCTGELEGMGLLDRLRDELLVGGIPEGGNGDEPA